MPKPFAVVVLQHHSVRLVGVSINTNLQQAPVDCPQLWNNVFNPRMPELSGKPAHLYQGPSYGISVFTDHEGLAFDYWAAMEAPDVAALPTGMSEVTLPGGWYACCRIPPPACCAKLTTTCTRNGPIPPMALPYNSTSPVLNATTAALFNRARTMCMCLFCPTSPDPLDLRPLRALLPAQSCPYAHASRYCSAPTIHTSKVCD